MNDKDIGVLLIEDNPGDIELIQQMLSKAPFSSFHVECVDQLSTGLERLAKGMIDIILLDLRLPDSQGVDTVVQVYAENPGVPIIVLTGINDQSLAIEALMKGAQDYLCKGELNSSILIRAVRYAIERHKLQFELEQIKNRKQQENEMRSLDALSINSSSSITSSMFGLKLLRDALPEEFDLLVQMYINVVDLSLDQVQYKVEHNIQEKLLSMAEKLGFLKSGPRDVVDIYSTAIRNHVENMTPAKAKAYIEEGKIIALQLMGYLVSFYRDLSLGFKQMRNVSRYKSRENTPVREENR